MVIVLNDYTLHLDLAPLSFALQSVAKLLWTCLCLFHAIVELHAMDEEMFNDSLIGEWKWIYM